MAGPGGGPPRKSHTKSRKGCRTCKKRHIRCDEQFPQCRNCTKHSARCDYLDVSSAGEEPTKGLNHPNLLTPPQLQEVLDKWRLSGEAPLSELRKSDSGYWIRFSTIDLRLIHHITTLSSEMYRRRYSLCAPWTPKMSNLISVALSSDFTMNALLALSASHLAWQTKNSGAEQLAYHHRSVAVKGLQDATNSFSEHSSEAVLAASMLLSWQARDWRSWVSLQQGISTVMNAVRPWMHQSELAKFLDSQRLLARIKTPSTPSLSGLPPQQPAHDDAARLEQTMTALHNLRLRLQSFPDLIPYVDDVLEYAQQIQQELYSMQGPDRAFEKLLKLRSLVLWIPTILLEVGDSDLGALAMLAHFYALALVLEPLFPEIYGAYLGNMSLEPLEKVCQLIQQRSAAVPHDASLQTALSMLEFPIEIAHAYRTDRRSMTSSTDSYRYSAQNNPLNYLPQSITLPSPDVGRHGSYSSSSMQSPASIPYGSSFMSSYASTAPIRRESSSSRAQSDPRLSGTSPLHSVGYPQQSNSEPHSANIDYFAGPSAYQQPSPYGGIHEYQNRLVQPTSY